MSSFLGAGRTYGFNLDLIESPSSSSGCSSTLYKSSSVSISSLSILPKRARTPRKRPDQSYIEAATLLSTACPNVFPINNLHKKYSGSVSSLAPSSLSSSDVLSPFQALNEGDFLIEEPSPGSNPSFNSKFKARTSVEEPCIVFQEASPPSPPEYDVDSIFDDEAAEGIDSIMGKLSMNDCDSSSNSYVIPYINSFVGSPIWLGLGRKFGVSFGVEQHRSIQQVLRGTHNEDDWERLTVMVEMQDVVPRFNALPSLDMRTKKKKKMKKVEEVEDEFEVIKTTAATNITPSPCKLAGEAKSDLGLKLNHEEVIKAWGDRGFPFSCNSVPLKSSMEISARLAEIDLFPDTRGGIMREATVQRYLEKRKTRHFNNIHYKVRKMNADCKPRLKGRFVKKTHFLHEAVGKDG